MTRKADFTEDEWKQVLEGPTGAGMAVIASDRGGSIRETFSMAKAYTEARKQHGESELLDEVVGTKPEMDRTRYKTPEEMKEGSIRQIREAMDVLKAKATPEEVEQYRQFVLDLANRVAEARKEGFMGLSGERVSDAERQAIEDVKGALA